MSKYVICCLVLLLQSQIALGLDLNLFENPNRWGVFNRDTNAFNPHYRTINNSGPYTSDWETYGPQGSAISDICCISKDTILAATKQSGIYRSCDGGNSWARYLLDTERIIPALLSKNTIDINYLHNRVLVATEHGFYNSSDKGQNWELLIFYLGSGAIHSSIVSHPEDENIIYTGLYRGNSMFGWGFHYTIDNGTTWHENNIGLGSTDITGLYISPHNSDYLYACTLNGIYINTNRGIGQWNNISPITSDKRVVTLYCSPFTKGELYAGLFNGLYKSVDNGQTWENISPDILPNKLIRAIVQTNDSTLFVGTSQGIIQTKDGGKTWRTDNNGLECISVNCIQVNGNKVLLGTEEGFYKRDIDETEWQRKVEGMDGLAGRSLLIDDSGPETNLYYGTDGAGMYYKCGDGDWYDAQIDSGFCTINDIKQTNIENKVWTVLTNGYDNQYNDIAMDIVCSTPTFSKVDGIDRFFSNDIGILFTIFPFSDSLLFAGTNVGLFRTVNKGKDWQKVLFAEESLPVVFVNSLDGCNFLLGTDYGNVNSMHGVYYSENGLDWTFANEGKQQHIFIVYDMCCNPQNEQTVWATNYFNGLLKSVDGGKSWSFIESDLDCPYDFYYTIAVHPADSNIVVAAGIDAHISYDAGETWGPFPAAFPEGSGICYKIRFDQNDPSIIYAVTDGSGLLRYRGVLTSVNEKDPVIPRTIGLKQNYPNPFNSSTMIEYELAGMGNAQLVIYNMLGQKVRTLVNEYRSAGQYTQSWDGLDDNGQTVSAGLYLCHLIANNQQATIKLLYVP